MKINSLEMIAEKIISVITIERDAYTVNWICTVYNEKYTVWVVHWLNVWLRLTRLCPEWKWYQHVCYSVSSIWKKDISSNIINETNQNSYCYSCEQLSHEIMTHCSACKNARRFSIIEQRNLFDFCHGTRDQEVKRKYLQSLLVFYDELLYSLSLLTKYYRD